MVERGPKKILNIGSAFSQRFLTAAMSNRVYKFETAENARWETMFIKWRDTLMGNSLKLPLKTWL